MPKIERIDVLDDLEYRGGAPDGKEVAATTQRTLTVGNQDYLLYLSEQNAVRFDEDIAVWTEFANKVEADEPRTPRKPTGGGGKGGKGGRNRGLSAEIRTWAREQNIQPPVSERGRIPDNVTQAFYAANPDKRPV